MPPDNRMSAAGVIDAVFNPRAIAIVGASSDPAKIGGRPVDYLLRFGYSGGIYPVNPGRPAIQGLPSFPSASAIGKPVDLAIISVPAARVGAMIDDCAQAGVRACTVLSSGFAETGEHGAELQRRLTAQCARLGIALVGPNCVGFMIPRTGVAATFTTTFSGITEVPSGSIALLSQSGALAAHLQKSLQERGLGLSAFITTGNEAGLTFADFVSYLAADETTKVICGYLEGVQDAGALLAAIRAATASGTPVVLTKAGVSKTGGVAAASHTGNLAGPGRIALSALRQAGAVIAESLEELMDICELASLTGPLPGRRVGVVGISGGTGVLVTDAVDKFGLSMASLGQECLDEVRAVAPDFASIANPIDLTGRPLWETDMIGQVVRSVLRSPGTDVAVLNLSSGIDEEVGGKWINDLAEIRATAGKPFVATWLSGEQEHLVRLRAEGVPVFTDPFRCARALAALAPTAPAAAEPASPLPDTAEATGSWTERETKEWLSGHGLPVPVSALAQTPAECAGAAESIGYPVVLKAQSRQIKHKTEMGAVVVGIADQRCVVREASEMLSRITRELGRVDDLVFLVEQQAPSGVEVFLAALNDPVFGHMLAVGVGGILVEVVDGIAWRRLPVTMADIDAMIDETILGKLLSGSRSTAPYDRQAIVKLAAEFAELIGELPEEWSSVELNPVVAGHHGEGACVLDALAMGLDPHS